MDNPIPPDTESPNERRDRHSAHAFLMEEQKQAKVRARERHKLNRGRDKPYCGSLY